MRVLCVHFPDWSLQRIRQCRPELHHAPLAILRPSAGKGSKVIARCELAREQGVRPGMVQAESLATAPKLVYVEEDLDADRQALLQLADEAQRWSPLVGLEEAIVPTCLLIDTTGCAACFGGEEAMVRKVCEEYRANGWTVAVALADTIGAAWAIAHFFPFSVLGSRFSVLHSVDRLAATRVFERSAESPLAPLRRLRVAANGETNEEPRTENREPRMIQDLPLPALRLSESAVSLLAQLGIERIGQLMALPRDQLAERFGAEVGLRLDQALGQVAEVITPFRAPEEAAASWVFDEPVEHQAIVATILDRLLQRLETILEQRHCGTRLVECVLEQEGASERRIECSLSRPARAASYLSGLLRLRLEQIRMEAPIRAMCVRAVVLEKLSDQQPSLFDTAGETDEAALAHLLDSLASRLGPDTVTVARSVADPQPELACRFESALTKKGSGSFFAQKIDDERLSRLQAKKEPDPFFASESHRPLRLFPRPISIEVIAVVPGGMPQRIHFADADHVVAHSQGPERIETGWWRDADIHRDYFTVETAEGTRWWIFRRRDDGRWFLHGCFD